MMEFVKNTFSLSSESLESNPNLEEIVINENMSQEEFEKNINIFSKYIENSVLNNKKITNEEKIKGYTLVIVYITQCKTQDNSKHVIKVFRNILKNFQKRLTTRNTVYSDVIPTAFIKKFEKFYKEMKFVFSYDRYNFDEKLNDVYEDVYEDVKNNIKF